MKKLVSLGVLLLIFVSNSSLTQDRTCKNSLVRFGEEMSAPLAGFTDGVIIEPVNIGFNVIDSVELRVDYVLVESAATEAKLVTLSKSSNDDSPGGIRTWGAFLEAYSPAPGTHTANAIFHITPEACAFFGASFPCDIQVGPVCFEIIAD